MMNKRFIGWLSFIFAFFHVHGYANGDEHSYYVPDIAHVHDEPIPILSAEKDVPGRDKKALKYATQWINHDTYPHHDNDRVVYLFGAGQPTLICAPLEVCVIYFQPGESIVENGIHIGDSTRWLVSPAIGAHERTQLMIKPVDVGLQTSLVAVTDRRTYHIKLLSRRKDYMPGIAFKYPDETAVDWQIYQQKNAQRKASQNKKEHPLLEKLDFNYRISGDCNSCEFKPVRVYNDGQQTIIELPASAYHNDIPALLVISETGEQLVNYRFHEGKYLVDRVFKNAILIRGVGKNQEKVSIQWLGKKS